MSGASRSSSPAAAGGPQRLSNSSQPGSSASRPGSSASRPGTATSLWSNYDLDEVRVGRRAREGGSRAREGCSAGKREGEGGCQGCPTARKMPYSFFNPSSPSSLRTPLRAWSRPWRPPPPCPRPRPPLDDPVTAPPSKAPPAASAEAAAGPPRHRHRLRDSGASVPPAALSARPRHPLLHPPRAGH